MSRRAAQPWRPADDGILLLVRLTPKAARDDIDGILELADDRAVLAARVRAVPEKGAANKALLKLIAKAFHLPRNRVEVTSGTTARLKTVKLDGDPRQLGRICATLPDLRSD